VEVEPTSRWASRHRSSGRRRGAGEERCGGPQGGGGTQGGRSGGGGGRLDAAEDRRDAVTCCFGRRAAGREGRGEQRWRGAEEEEGRVGAE